MKFLKSLKYQNSSSQNSSNICANMRELENGTREACVIATLSWMLLLVITLLIVTPRKNFVLLNKLERNSSHIACIFIIISFIFRLSPSMCHKGSSNKQKHKFASCHGVVLVRWVEWTPLAFLMTFMTDVIGMEDCNNNCSICSTDTTTNAISKDNNNDFTSTNNNKHNHHDGNLRQAWLLVTLQGLSTICGLIFPFCTKKLYGYV